MCRTGLWVPLGLTRPNSNQHNNRAKPQIIHIQMIKLKLINHIVITTKFLNDNEESLGCSISKRKSNQTLTRFY